MTEIFDHIFVVASEPVNVLLGSFKTLNYNCVTSNNSQLMIGREYFNKGK